MSAPNTVDRGKRVVADEYGITVAELLSSAKRHAAAHPRQLAMWLCRECVSGAYGRPISTEVLARLFHRKDHSTVWHALRAVQRRIAEEKGFARRVRALRDRIASETFRPRALVDASDLFPAIAAGPVKHRGCMIYAIRRMNSTANGSATGGAPRLPAAPRLELARSASQFREAAQ